MKKISIILSAALLAATFALAGCSNVSELNGSEWDIYSAGASGKTAAQAKKDAEAEATAAAEKVTVTITDAKITGGKAEFKYKVTDKIPTSYSVNLIDGYTATAKDAITLTLTVGSTDIVYKNAEIKAGDKSITFNVDKTHPASNTYAGDYSFFSLNALKGSNLTASFGAGVTL